MIRKDVQKTQDGVSIDFSGAIAKETVFTMVQNCAEGKCECMSDETKQKVTDMVVSGEDGSVNLELKGEITQEEIEEALKRSKVISS
ncbi:MAG: hypothetical protein GXO11_06480 [Epsilonproteobacteria bacterium]|nr:hypothetical protein [Campylobacterota bacterium]